MSCVCDYDGTYDFYRVTHPVARKQHTCAECGRAIHPGETYERVGSKFEGWLQSYKTCCRCVALREYVKAHVPCFCWFHENMVEDAMETVREYAHEAPGLLFGAYRLKVQIDRNPPVPRRLK